MSRRSLYPSFFFILCVLGIGYIAWNFQTSASAQPAAVQSYNGVPDTTVEIHTPAESVNDVTPTVTGTLRNNRGGRLSATISIYSYTEQRDIQTFSVTASTHDTFSIKVPKPLTDGQYTVTVRYTGNTSIQAGRSFFVDTTPPRVTLTGKNVHGMPTLTGTIPIGAQDGTEATIDVYYNTDTTVAPVRRQLADVSRDGIFTTGTIDDLLPGQYTAVARQTDYAGNTGQSQPMTFVVIRPHDDTRVLPQIITLHAAYITDGTILRYRFNGALTLPPKMISHNRCQGTVMVTARHQSSVEYRRMIRLNSDCTYRSHKPVTTRSHTLTITAQYRGNHAVQPRTAKSVSINSR